MASVVHKFVLDTAGAQLGAVAPLEVSLPADAIILHADVQHGAMCLWVLTNPDLSTKETRAIILLPTGAKLPDHPLNLKHLGTLLLNGGEFVVHLFERML